jgi:hypothetical protein
LVTGKNEPITNIRYLKHPPLEIVAKLGKYNRANTPETTLFYSAQNIDTALKEIRPPLNKLVTVGIWQQKDVNKHLITYPISHSAAAMGVSEGVRKATEAFNEQMVHNSKLLKNYYERYLKLVGREFSKVVDHHYGYFISSHLAERIFDADNEDDAGFKIDAIVYPSVGNDYLSENLAIRPHTLENDFKLIAVLEFEIEEAYYDQSYTTDNPFAITLAKIRNVRKTTNISPDGEIIW